MRLLVDADLPISLGVALRAGGHDVLTAHEMQPPILSDPDVYQRAVADRRILITRDLDFSNILAFQPKAPTGIVVLRVRALLPKDVAALVRDVLGRLTELQLQGAITIVQPGRYRRYPIG